MRDDGNQLDGNHLAVQKRKQLFFENDQSLLSDEFYRKSFFPEYLSGLNFESDASALELIDAKGSPLHSCSLSRLFALAEQIVNKTGKGCPGMKSFSVVLEKPIWLSPLTFTRCCSRSASSNEKNLA